jgi:CRISPR-associated protein Cas1
VSGGRVEYVTNAGKRSLYWNIPIANTTSILLGTGTSITQAAMRKLAQAGVLVGFCGGGGTPLFHANEQDFEVAWFSPQSEYRPTEYLQKWIGFWLVESQRLKAAKLLQKTRLLYIKNRWLQKVNSKDRLFNICNDSLEGLLSKSLNNIEIAQDVMALLVEEARVTKRLFKFASDAVEYGDFTRAKGGSGYDPANRFLDHGNYLAYGLGATATWVLGLPHGLSVLHGKTRRGGLVFDAADLIKDAIILPQAFIASMRGDDDQQFRMNCIDELTSAGALDFIIDTLKKIAADVELTE